MQQSTKPAKLSANGSFSGSISYIFQDKTAYKGVFKGRFVKRKLIEGTLRSEYKSSECNGSTSFQATPAGAL